MRSGRLPLAVAVVVVALAGCIATAASYAAAPTASVRLHAQAGPVTMHAVLTLTVRQPAAAKAVGNLSACVVQSSSKPRSGLPDKIACTSTTGTKVVVQSAPTSAVLTYQLASSSPHVSLQSATVEIRHGTTVLFTLTSSSGTISIPRDQVAVLLNGHDMLYVHAGAHTYLGKIVH